MSSCRMQNTKYIMNKDPLFMNSTLLVQKPILKFDDPREQEIWNVLSNLFSNEIIYEIFEFDYFFESKVTIDLLIPVIKDKIANLKYANNQYLAISEINWIYFLKIDGKKTKYHSSCYQMKIDHLIPFISEFFISLHNNSYYRLILWSRHGNMKNFFHYNKPIIKLLDVTDIAYLMDHNIHLISCSSGSIQLWSFQNDVLKTFFEFIACPNISDIIHINTLLISISKDSCFVTIWDLVSLKKIRFIQFNENIYTLLQFSETECIISVANGSLILYNFITDTQKEFLDVFFDPVFKLTKYSLNEVIVHCKTNDVILFNFETRQSIKMSNINPDVIILPDGSILSSNKLWKPFAGNTVEIFDKDFIWTKLTNGEIIQINPIRSV